MFSHNSSRLGRINYINSYEEAKLRHSRIKPIRGRAVDVRPLCSDRSGPDQYSIRKVIVDGREVYQCVLYNTPVLSYYPNGDVAINFGGWGTATSRAFVGEILGVACCRSKGNDYLLIGGKESPLTQCIVLPHTPTVLRRNTQGEWELVSTGGTKEVRLNKQSANNVRARYKEFDKYLKGLIKLRAHEENRKFYDPGPVVDVGISEYADAFGEDGLKLLAGIRWDALTNKQYYGAAYREVNEMFFGFINPEQPEEGRHLNFYKGFLSLVVAHYGPMMFNPYQQRRGPVQEYPTKVGHILKKYKEALYKWHSNEVFDVVELPMGTVPNNQYKNWV